jgi:GGDEF domain-containing protein
MATSESTRARRFALPDMAADVRTEEAIEAFIEGPEVRRHRPAARRRRRKPASAQQATAVQVAETPFVVMPRVSTDIRSLPGRLEWNAALERESLRAARYGRPAAVAIVELVGERTNAQIEPWIRLVAGPIATTLRGSSRATDLVARVAMTRFQILLPETSETGAARFAERLSAACSDALDHSGAPVTLRVSVATATPDHSLREALADALRSIEAA